MLTPAELEAFYQQVKSSTALPVKMLQPLLLQTGV
jgi:hypothetical protein